MDAKVGDGDESLRTCSLAHHEYPRGLRLRPDLELAQQLAAAERLTETILFSYLCRAALAAHLAAHVSSTAS